MSIKDEVIALHEKYCTSNPFRIAKEKWVIICYENLGSILGYHNYDSRFHFIHINTNLSDDEKYFTCAHEFGHVILHPKKHIIFKKSHIIFNITYRAAGKYLRSRITNA